ncbi:hypothetical protein [Rhizobium phage RHph_X2_26]|nr:hypothetical protein [Rhizobium phage RHph_X2_26]
MTYDAYNPRAVIGGNKPPQEAVFERINDLYEEAKNWADGAGVETQEQHDAVTKLDEMLAAAGKEADELRTDEKKPLDEKVKEIQDRFNPFIQPKKGKVDRARAALKETLTAYRVKEAERKAAEARARQEAADLAMRQAQAAMKSSSGNLDAREEAEELAAEAKQAQRDANRATRDAGKGNGLRTVTTVTLNDDPELGLDWAFSKDAARFYRLAEEMATEHQRITKCSHLDGFTIKTEKVAR